MVKFVIATTNVNQYPQHNQLEACLVGRSNVGKSTLVNALAKRKIAYVSKTPGRTRTINFYDFNHYWIVDLPGYGYAKLSKQVSANLALFGEEYLLYRSNLNTIIHVCDLNVITNLDLEIKDYLITNFDNYLLCLNKSDQLLFGAQKQRLLVVSQMMQLPLTKILVVSGKEKINIDQLARIIYKWTAKK